MTDEVAGAGTGAGGDHMPHQHVGTVGAPGGYHLRCMAAVVDVADAVAAADPCRACFHYYPLPNHHYHPCYHQAL